MATPRPRSSFGQNKTTFGIGAHFAGLSIFATDLNEVTIGIMAFKSAMALAAVGFEVLTKSATELVGAIAQLGGAKGIQQMFVESVTNQSLMNQTRFVVSGEERATGKELMDLTAKLSENSETGAFDRKEWLETIKQIGIVTGRQRSLDEGTLETLGKFAVVTGSTIEEQGQIFSRLQAQNRGLNNDQIIQLMLNLHAVGQRGSFSEAELAKSPALLGLRNLFTGKPEAIENLLGTVGSAFVGGGAAENQQEAGTLFGSILNAAMKSKSPIWHRSGVTGQFGAPEDILTDLVNTAQDTLDTELSKSGLGSNVLARARRGTIQLREQISQAAGVANDESPEAQAARKRFIDDMINMHYTTEQLNAEFDQTRGPQERFRAAFNRITDHLEAKFLDTLYRMQPRLDAFADTIINHEDDIADFFDKLANYLGTAVAKFPLFLDVMAGLATAVGNVTQWILEHTPGAASNKAEAIAKSQDITDKINTEYALLNTPGLSDEGKKTALAQIAKFNQQWKDNQTLLKFYDAAGGLTPEAFAQESALQAQIERENRMLAAAQARFGAAQSAASFAARQAAHGGGGGGGGGGGDSSFVKDLNAALQISNRHLEVIAKTNTAMVSDSVPAAPQTSATGR